MHGHIRVDDGNNPKFQTIFAYKVNGVCKQVFLRVYV